MIPDSDGCTHVIKLAASDIQNQAKKARAEPKKDPMREKARTAAKKARAVVASAIR